MLNKIKTGFFIFIFISCLSSMAEIPMITPEYKSISPNKKYLAKLDTSSESIQILDAEYLKPIVSFNMPTILYRLDWTGDSLTLVALQHQAHGCFVSAMSVKTGNWKYYRVTPEEKNSKYAVVELKINYNNIFISYKVTKTNSINESKYYIISFYFNPEIGEKYKIQNRLINETIYKRIKTLDE